ncbi:MAG: YkgJ family cysteine cluster protein [Desulfobacteraceae bacterium]|nr:YkgJ family cysteine cluster protein [Desulfobacteraceae bacterium]
MASVDRLAFDQALKPLLGDLEQLYEEMDREYARVAARYGFQCTGCIDNCCLSRFYHYTYSEYIYLRRGFAQLSQQKRAEVRKRAEKYVEALEQRGSQGDDSPFRMMCPLNESGLCILYSRRPMICRLHGLPHELALPGRPKTVFGPGCHEFAEKCGHLPYYPFDRTRFYMCMSELEAGARKILGASQKPKKTVAHMLICDEVERL